MQSIGREGGRTERRKECERKKGQSDRGSRRRERGKTEGENREREREGREKKGEQRARVRIEGGEVGWTEGGRERA